MVRFRVGGGLRLLYALVTSTTAPNGLVKQACVNWKRKANQRFFGHSYTSRLPKEFTAQQLGLVMTKAFGLHLCNATQTMGIEPGVDAEAPCHNDYNFHVDLRHSHKFRSKHCRFIPKYFYLWYLGRFIVVSRGGYLLT